MDAIDEAILKLNEFRPKRDITLKPLQRDAIFSAMQKDTLVVLPTGYGKSIIYEALPFIADNKIIVISPLTAIIDEQSAKFKNSLKVNKHLFENPTNQLKDCSASVYFGHPEAFLTKEATDLLLSEKWQTSTISNIVIDEAHCIVNCGHEFRPEYSNLSKLRAIFPNAKMLALTATATKKMQAEITRNLLMKSFNLIFHRVDRSNIKLDVKLRPSSPHDGMNSDECIEELLKPIVYEFCKDPSSFRRTVIFSKLKWCYIGYQLVLRESRLFTDKELIKNSIAQYHAICTSTERKNVVDDMANPLGSIKLLFATEAYSMGTDCPNLRDVHFIGVPHSLEMFVQMMGRVGRDDVLSVGIVHFNNADIAQNKANSVQPEMREFCLTSDCRRLFISKHFSDDNLSPFPYDLHLCCDVCGVLCSVGPDWPLLRRHPRGGVDAGHDGEPPLCRPGGRHQLQLGKSPLFSAVL